MQRSYAGGAAVARLKQDFGGTDNDRVLYLDDANGYPTGDGGPFYVSVNRGKPKEEKILCAASSKNADGSGTLTVFVDKSGKVYRGDDETAIQSHPVGSTVEHVHTATDAREANWAAQSLVAHPAHGHGTWRDLMAP